jgi:sugar (pentulose or hexulose) kinase
LDTQKVVECCGVLCVPGSHDSVYARIVGFSTAPFVVWTGTWLGVAANIEGTGVVPCEDTMKAGLSFEGLDPQAVQKNTGMFGPVFEELRKRTGLSYGECDEAVLAESNLPRLQPSLLTNSLPGDAADHVLQTLRENGQEGSDRRAVAAVVQCAARTIAEDLNKVAKAVKRPLERIAVVGGWAKSRAFCELLGRFSEASVAIPPHAARATEVGYMAHMLYRIMKAKGSPMTVADILPELPTISEN